MRRKTLMALMLAASAGLAQPSLIEDEPDRASSDSRGGLASDFDITLPAFSEPVELQTLIEFVAEELQVNITIIGSVEGEVVFNRPVAINADDLIPMLDSLLEQWNYTILEISPGTFHVVEGVRITPNNNGDYATTRIMYTDNVRPSAIKPVVEKQLGLDEGNAKRYAYFDELGFIMATDTPRNLDVLQMLVDSVLAEYGQLRHERIELRYIAADAARRRAIQYVGGDAPQDASNFGNFNANNVPGRVNNPEGRSGSLGMQETLDNIEERLAVAPSGNAVIFRGRPSEIARVREVISFIDVPNKLEPRRYYAGVYATEIAEYAQGRGLGQMTSIAEDTSQSGDPRFNNLNRNLGNQFGNTRNQTVQGGGPTLVVNPERGTIVYYGTTEMHEELDGLIEEFDIGQDRVVIREYKLNHADAEEVADLIDAIINERSLVGESDLLPQSRGSFNQGRGNQPSVEPDPAAAAGDGDGVSIQSRDDTFVTAFPAQNMVLVKAPLKLQQDFYKLIAKLDLKRPQVYIDAMIVSITDSDGFRLRFESQFVNAGGSGGAITIAPGNLSAPGETFIDPINVATGLAGFTGAVIKSEYVPIIINAVATTTDTKIISRPQLLVNDNEEATIAAIQEQPTSSTSQGDSSTITSFQGYEEAGTTLAVTPQISHGGYLNLEYEINLSSFNGEATADLPPPRSTNDLAGKVTIPGDSTIVVGGIKARTDRDTIVKIPLLGDIPLLGHLFRDTQKSSDETTLYVFITPRILSDDDFDDMRVLTQGPRAEVGVDPELPVLEGSFIRTGPGLSRPSASAIIETEQNSGQVGRMEHDAASEDDFQPPIDLVDPEDGPDRDELDRDELDRDEPGRMEDDGN